MRLREPSGPRLEQQPRAFSFGAAQPLNVLDNRGDCLLVPKPAFVPAGQNKSLESQCGGTPPGPTTQSHATGDFLKVYERPRIGGDVCDGSFSETASLQSADRFCAFFSGPEIPFPGNRDRERQRLGSNAGYAEGSPSIWCCRDHSAGMSARRATPMP